MKQKNDFIQTIMAIALIILAPGIIIALIDPYHVFHRPIFKKHGFDDKKLFFHVAGMINNYLLDPEENYNAAVIGASTATGYTQEIFNTEIKWGRTLNLSISGSNAQQHSIIAKRILAHSEIKHLFWDLSFHYGYGDYDIEKFDTDPSEEPMPQYLYNKSITDDYRYFFNISILEASLKLISGDFSDFPHGIEASSSWINSKAANDLFRTNSTKKNLEEIYSNIKGSQRYPLDENQRKTLVFPTINNRLLPVIMQYCNTDIDIVLNFAPRLRHSFLTLNETLFYDEFYMRRYLVEKTAECRNLRIFAFDTNDEISSDTNNYMDDMHFNYLTSKKILGLISKNTNRLTKYNIDDYENEFMKKLNAYPDHLREIISKTQPE